MNTTFGEYLRKLRLRKGFTLTQLAAQINLDSANLSKIENDKRDFDKKRLKHLSVVLDVDIEELKLEYFSDWICKNIQDVDSIEELFDLSIKKIKIKKQKK